MFDFAAVYHNRLRLVISQKYEWIPISVINAGASGDTAEGGLQRLARDVIERRPDLCVVCYGLNDVGGELEEYSGALRSIFTELRNAGIETLFMTPNMLNTRVADDAPPEYLAYAHKTAEMQNSGRMDAFMAAAVALTQEMVVCDCDCYAKRKALAEVQDVTSLLANRINHPTPEMHELFAQSLYDVIMEGGGSAEGTSSTMIYET